MEIKNLKELQKLIQLCRKQGVDKLKLGETEIWLGAVPYKHTKDTSVDTYKSAFDPGQLVPMDEKIATQELTEEELLYYSADSGAGANQ